MLDPPVVFITLGTYLPCFNRFFCHLHWSLFYTFPLANITRLCHLESRGLSNIKVDQIYHVEMAQFKANNTQLCSGADKTSTQIQYYLNVKK